MFDADDFIVGEGRADKPIGYPPNPIIRRALENLYISIMGALDVGDFETLLKESSDLSYEEAKDKTIREYGSPTQLSAARLKAKSSEAASKLELAEMEATGEQRTLETEFAELDEIARKRLNDNLELIRRNQDIENELKRMKEELAKAKAVPPTALPPRAPVPAAPPAAPSAHGSMYDEYLGRINEVFTIRDMNDLASDIFDIAEREEYAKLTKPDIDELMKRLRELIEKRSLAKAVPPAALPPRAPVPAAPPAAPSAHGSMYDEYLGRINEVFTIRDMNNLASEIFDIAEREEYAKLTKPDIDELMKSLREITEKRSIQLAEMRLPKLKPTIHRPPALERAEEPPEYMGVLPPQVMHRYLRPDIEKAAFGGVEFIRDYELERTIIRNNLLLFPPHWYAFPSSEKFKRYGYDIAAAFKHAVEYLHKFSWEDLTKDYGIPEKYVEAWKKTG